MNYLKNKGLRVKTLIVFIIIIMVFSLNPVDNVLASVWTDSATGIVWTYTLSGSNATKVYTQTTNLNGTITIPSTINGYMVTSIGYGTSSYRVINNATSRVNVTGVIIPSTVTSILGYSFNGMTKLSEIIIPENVTTLGSNIFQDCTSLSEITINAYSISTYPSSSYPLLKNVTSVKTVNIGEGVTYFDIYKLFLGSINTDITLNFNAINYTDSYFGSGANTMITKLNISENVGKYSSNITENLTGLTEINYNAIDASTISSSQYGLPLSSIVNIGENVINVPAYSFYGANTYNMFSKNTTLDANSIGKQYDTNTIYGWYNTPANTYATTNSIKFIDKDSFGTELIDGVEWYYLKNVDGTAVIKPNDLSSLTENIAVPSIISGSVVVGLIDEAFRTSNIVSITIPDSITSIGANMFNGSSNLNTVNLADTITSIGEYAFSNCSSLNNVTIPGGLTKIENGTFNNCDSLTSIFIPDTITSIGEYAFSDCDNLSDITISNSITKISSGSFSSLPKLVGITIPEGVVTIEDGAFSYDYSLETIFLPKSLKTIGDSAFSGLNSLQTINVADGNTAFKSIEGVLYNISVSKLLLFPKNSLITNYTIPNTINTISINTLNGSDSLIAGNNLTKITIPDSIISIGSDYGVINLQNNENAITVTILNKDIIISDYGIIGRSMYSDNSLTISSYNNSTAKTYAANNDYTFKIYTLTVYPYSTEYYINEIIDNTKTTTGTAEANVIIDSYTDYSSETLTQTNTENYPMTITETDNIMKIYLATATELIWKYDDVLGAYALNPEIASGELVIPSEIDGKTVTNLKYLAFEGNNNITSVSFPNSLTEIGHSAFKNCTSIISVKFPSSLTGLRGDTFLNCVNLVTVDFAEGSAFKQTTQADFWNTGIASFIIPEDDEITFNTIANWLSGDNLQSITVFNRNTLFTMSDGAVGEYGGAFIDSPNFTTVYGYTGSTSEAFASLYGYEFISLDTEMMYPLSIKYYFNGIIDNSKTENSTSAENSIIDVYTNYADVTYKLSSTTNYPMTITKNNNVMRIDYISGTIEPESNSSYEFDGNTISEQEFNEVIATQGILASIEFNVYVDNTLAYNVVKNKINSEEIIVGVKITPYSNYSNNYTIKELAYDVKDAIAYENTDNPITTIDILNILSVIESENPAAAKYNYVGEDFSITFLEGDNNAFDINLESRETIIVGNNETIITGNIDASSYDISFTNSLSFTINPDGEQKLISEILSICNRGNANIDVSINGLTNYSIMENVLPEKFGTQNDWFRLGKIDSKKYIALALRLINNNYCNPFITNDLYFKTIEDATGPIKLVSLGKDSSVEYEITGYHGLSFKEPISIQQKINWLFSLSE